MTLSDKDLTYLIVDDLLCNLGAVVGVPQTGVGLVFPTPYFVNTV